MTPNDEVLLMTLNVYTKHTQISKYERRSLKTEIENPSSKSKPTNAYYNIISNKMYLNSTKVLLFRKPNTLKSLLV